VTFESKSKADMGVEEEEEEEGGGNKGSEGWGDKASKVMAVCAGTTRNNEKVKSKKKEKAKTGVGGGGGEGEGKSNLSAVVEEEDKQDSASLYNLNE